MNNLKAHYPGEIIRTEIENIPNVVYWPTHTTDSTSQFPAQWHGPSTPLDLDAVKTGYSAVVHSDDLKLALDKVEQLYSKLEELIKNATKKHNSISYRGFYFVEDIETKSYSILDVDLKLISKYHDSLDSCKQYLDSNYE